MSMSFGNVTFLYQHVALERPFVRFLESSDRYAMTIAATMGTPDIVSLIAVELDVDDLSSLSGVCMCYAGIARRELRSRVYNILKRHVSSWTIGRDLSFLIVDRIKAFLQKLHEHRSVIAGLKALAVLVSHSKVFAKPTHDSNMEVFTPRNEAIPIVLYLTSVEGYSVEVPPRPHVLGTKFKPVDNHIDYWRRRSTVDSVTTLIRWSDRQRVFVIESATHTALSPLSQVANTLTCNWLDLHGVSCAYPRYTFRSYGTHNPSFKGDHRSSARYSLLLPLQGFNIGDFNHEKTHCTKSYAYCPRRRRISEDGMSFRMALWPYSDSDDRSQMDHCCTVTHLPRIMWIWGDWDNHASHDKPFEAGLYGVLAPQSSRSWGRQ